jgi:DNA sulfur modification protein DndB
MTNVKPQGFSYSFPAIRGVQSGREYYVTMCPLQYVARLFAAAEEGLPPELRAQRTLNKARLPGMTRYILDNPGTYVFSSLTASIDRPVQFIPHGEDEIERKIGTLVVPFDAKILINDGQHRRAAIEAALEQNPKLKYETISIVLFIDAGLKRSQQMFADLNRYAVRPTRSLSILYDHRDHTARLTDYLVNEVPVFSGMTEKAKSTISNRSRKLFTLSSIYQATKRLLNVKDGDEVSEGDQKLAKEFWIEVSKNIPDWMDAKERKVAPSELRSDYIHAHGVALQALAIAGSALIKQDVKNWRNRLSGIKKIDWSRQSAELWEGRALIGGRLSKSQNNVQLTANIIKHKLGLTLDPNEEKVERLYDKGKSQGR